MGYLWKRGPVWWIQYSHLGQRIRESTGATLKSVAEAILLQREAELASGKMPSVYFESVPLEEILEGYLQDYHINEKRSVRRAEQIVKLHLMKHFGPLRAVQIDTTRIKAYISARRGEGAANGTINRELTALKRAFRLAARHTPPKVQSVPYVPMLREENVREGFIEEEDFQGLREALPEYLRGLVTFGYVLGCRLSELTGLTWSNVNRAEGYIQLGPKETKSGEGRTIYLDSELREIIGAQFSKQGRARLAKRVPEGEPFCPYVFQHAGKRIRDFRGAWNEACKAIGRGGYSSALSDRITFHDLRRSAIRAMIRAGVSEHVAMKISGHKTRSVFARYDITSADDLKAAAVKVERYRIEREKPQKSHKKATIGEDFNMK